MRVDVFCEDRTGMTHAVLGAVAASGIDLATVEMVTHHVYLDAPTLAEPDLGRLRGALLAVDGVRSVEPLQVMPGERREMLLNTLLTALDEPVVAIDGGGEIIFANRAACRAGGRNDINGPIDALFDRPRGVAELLDPRRRREHVEVSLGNASYLLEVLPIWADDRTSLGAFLRLQSATRMGARLSAFQVWSHKGFDGIVGDSAQLTEAKAQAKRMCAVDLPVMITGETGTGKELFARAIHEHGPRHDAPFLALNCAALPENLAESELFGYAPGAFSGASRSGKPGLLELAHEGTVFLDEIAEMAPYLQAKLLRFVQDGSFRRVGGERERRVDVRIISATHRDLDVMVGEGGFREDLLYRLNVLNLHLPPLRERRGDVPCLVDHFLAQACRRVNRRVPRLSAGAMTVLEQARWRGNIRQLENCLYRLVSLSEAALLEADDIVQFARTDIDDASGGGQLDSWAGAIAGFEKKLLRELYPQFPSSRKLAKRLRVSHTTMADKLRKYQIR